MKRYLLAGLFVTALFSMLCIGFVLGIVLTPALGRIENFVGRALIFSLKIPRKGKPA